MHKVREEPSRYSSFPCSTTPKRRRLPRDTFVGDVALILNCQRSMDCTCTGQSPWKRYLFLMAILHVMQIAHSDTGATGNTGNAASVNGAQTNLSAELKGFPVAIPPPVWPGESDDEEEDDSSSEGSEYESWASMPEDGAQYLRPKPAAAAEATKQPKPSNSKAAASSERSAQSQPLKTLEKLQQMLDDTDYMTAKPDDHSGGSSPVDEPQIPKELDTEMPASFGSPPPPKYPAQQSASESSHDRLWTSADRSKYKQQQKRLRKKQLPPIQTSPSAPSSDDEQSDTDDGLEYTLPNLPIYLSDAEGDSDIEELVHRHPYEQTHNSHPNYQSQGHTYQQQHQYHHPPPPRQQQQPPPNPPQGVVLRPEQSAYNYPPSQYPVPLYPPDLYNPQQQQQQQQQGYSQQVSPYQGPNAPPQSYYGPYPYSQGQYGAQSQSPPPPQQQFAAWAASMGYVPANQYGPQPPQSWARTPPPTLPELKTTSSTKKAKKKKAKEPEKEVAGTEEKSPMIYPQPIPELKNQFAVTMEAVKPQSLAEMSSKISFDSIQKLSLMLVTGAMACYAAVSPRTLPQVEYNAMFYDNMRILALVLIAPLITFFSVLDAAENDCNRLIQSLYTSFSMGYVLVFLLEILATTLVRLSTFISLEPDVFSLVPKVPVILLPWVLRENRYRPKRITLFAADFLTSCVASPIIEEYIKFKLLQWTSNLPKNYLWAKKATKKRNMKMKREKIPRGPGERDVTNVNKYVSQMLAASIGLKLADSGRRVLMYTKPHHEAKIFYAICRGIFPIQELCGVMTALRLAKRDVLGAELSTFWILAPAVVVHGMANLRGMKPIFKWNSATPWSEMQLFPWSSADASTLPQLASKGFSKLMWLIIIMRVLGYCAKNYYYTNRQAEKRTTLYASNPAAVDAALASSDLLKKVQGKK